MKGRILLSVLIALTAAATAWAGPAMNPGKWEITTRTQMAGMPTQSMTHVQCITADDLVPVTQDASQQCRVTDIVNRGNTVSWKISCGDEEGGMTGTGSVTYNNTTMSGTMDMTVTGGANMRITNTMSGRRIGACDGSGSASSGSAAGATVANDLKDVGAAAKDEAKQSTIDAVRGEVRGLFKGMLD